MKKSSMLLLPAPALSRSAGGGRVCSSPMLAFILREVQRELSLSSEGKQVSRVEECERLVNDVAVRMGLDLTTFERTEILAAIERDDRPFGILQELVEDSSVSDVIVTDYTHIAVQQGRRNVRIDLAFPDAESYESFVEKLLLRAGTTYSTKRPITDGMIGEFARVHAVHRSICEGGPYLTVRLNRFPSVSIEDLIQSGVAPAPVLRYLQAIVGSGHTILIAGEVATGKTTLARGLAASIPDHESIVVIEDTPEVRLEHPHVRYISTRESNSDGAGRVSPSECIRGGMRMAMNRIIFGEIRDAEAAEAFIDVCASGHPGLSTIHSRSAAEAITRLELFLGRAQKGVESKVIAEQIATAVRVIVYVAICQETGQRRITEVREIGPVADGVIRQREIFRYAAVEGCAKWHVVNRVSAYRDKLERGEDPVVLSKMSAVLELADHLAYREAMGRARRVA